MLYSKVLLVVPEFLENLSTMIKYLDPIDDIQYITSGFDVTQTTYKSSQIAQQTKYITTVCPVWFKDSF